MNSKTFDFLFNRKVLQFISLRMEIYGKNSAVEVLGKLHAFFRWKSEVYRQLFYVTNMNNLPNLLSRDACYTLGVIKPCYSVETDSSSSSFQGIPQVTPTQPSKYLDQSNMQGECDSHCENEGNALETLNCSSKCSFVKDDLQRAPLTKARILDVYSDVFTGIGKRAIQVPAQRKCKTPKTCTKESFHSFTVCFPWGNQQFGTTWNPWTG